MILRKENLKSGDVLHCTSNGWLGKIIKKFTKSKINHTALVIEVWGEIFIVDSQKDGTNLRSLDNWNKMFNYEYKISRPYNFSVDLRNRVVSKIGATPYDFISLILWQPIYILTGKWHGHTRKDAEDKMYCSEFVSWVYSLNNWWENSPQMVYEELLNDDRFKLI